jgi:nucleoid DNA-binding protein
MTMTKAELIERVASRKDIPRELTKKAVARIVDAVFTEIGDYFIRARPTRTAPPRFAYPGFGTFTKRRRGARVVRNPQNGNPISIPPQSTLVFGISQELKGLINRDRDLRATSTNVAFTGR